MLAVLMQDGNETKPCFTRERMIVRCKGGNVSKIGLALGIPSFMQF